MTSDKKSMSSEKGTFTMKNVRANVCLYIPKFWTIIFAIIFVILLVLLFVLFNIDPDQRRTTVCD